MPRALCHRCQHQEHQHAGMIINCMASILLPSACSAVRCHPHAACRVTKVVSEGPCVAQVWLSGLCTGSHRAALCHTVSRPASSSISAGGLAPLQSSCRAMPGEAPDPSSPPSLAAAARSCAWPGGGSLTAPVPSKAGRVLLGTMFLLCPSRGKLSIQLRLRVYCRAPRVLELWAGAAFPCLQFVMLGQGGHGRTAVGTAPGEREAEGS